MLCYTDPNNTNCVAMSAAGDVLGVTQSFHGFAATDITRTV